MKKRSFFIFLTFAMLIFAFFNGSAYATDEEISTEESVKVEETFGEKDIISEETDDKEDDEKILGGGVRRSSYP